MLPSVAIAEENGVQLYQAFHRHRRHVDRVQDQTEMILCMSIKIVLIQPCPTESSSEVWSSGLGSTCLAQATQRYRSWMMSWSTQPEQQSKVLCSASGVWCVRYVFSLTPQFRIRGMLRW